MKCFCFFQFYGRVFIRLFLSYKKSYWKSAFFSPWIIVFSPISAYNRWSLFLYQGLYIPKGISRSYAKTQCEYITYFSDADPGQWDLCVVAAMDKFTWTTEILWRKGTAWPLFKWERGPRPPPGQAFIVFLGTLHQGWSSFTMHRFALGGYLLQTTKERMLLKTSKKNICKCKGKSGWTSYTPYLEGLAQIFRKLKILSKHLLPQFRVREF